MRKSSKSAGEKRRWLTRTGLRRVSLLLAVSSLVPVLVLFLAAYLPIAVSWLGMSDAERAVQAYLTEADLQLYFRCDPLYGDPGPTVFGDWVRHEGDHYLIDWWGKRTDYFMEDGARRVVGPTPIPGALKVVCLGDSSAFGFGLTDDQTFPSHLQSTLGDEFEVKNLAWPGLDVENYLQEWERVTAHAPDILIVALSHNSMRNTIWVRRCHGIEGTPVLSYPAFHLKVLHEVWHSLLNWSRRVVLRRPLVDISLVGPEIYGRKMAELIRRARNRGMDVILVRHDLLLKKPEEIRGFEPWVAFGQALSSLAEETETPLVQLSELYGDLGFDESAPAGHSLDCLRAQGYDETALTEFFKEDAAFVDFIHPSAAANSALARRVAEIIRERSEGPKAGLR